MHVLKNTCRKTTCTCTCTCTCGLCFAFDCFFLSKCVCVLKTVGFECRPKTGFVIVCECVYYTVCIVWFCVLSQRPTLIKPQVWLKSRVEIRRRKGERERERERESERE